MRITSSFVACAAGALLLAACSGKPRAQAPATAPGPPLVTLTVRPVRTAAEWRLDGTVEAIDHATVAAQTSGRVAAINYDVGDYVPAGAVIVRLRATEQHAGLLQAKAALRAASARALEADTRYGRIRDMYERQVLPKADLDQATAERDASVAQFSAARAAVVSAEQGVAYTEVRAPYAGVVTQRLVQVGETVAPGTPLMSGVSLKRLRVVVDIPQPIVDAVRRNMKAAIYAEGRRIEATHLTVFPVASTPSNTFRAWLDLPEGLPGVSPGMLVKVGVVVGERERLLVPASAIVRRSAVTAVYLVEQDGWTSMQQVRLGEAVGDRFEVLSGLMPGDRVALDPLAAMRRLGPAGSDASAVQ
ncbi:MAG TPA: efflux RND transporter periplasmic adaptor subunit [Steroidobacteraceae bacterium]|nr:efflux RND transporter periplasmic adaptor subunit [Steroidobacteraceae bacterium]